MKKFGLIGETLAHSFSKDYFSKKFLQLGISAEYFNFELSNISDVLKIKKMSDIEGLNVTIPYKTTILPFLDELDETAEAIGAVNTIKITRGKWIGYNTDAFGFKQLIAPFLKGNHQKALIIGTGGAAKAVSFVLENIGLEVNYLSRNPAGKNVFGYDEVNDNMIAFHPVIVNCTPIGTAPKVDECPTLNYEAFSENHLAIDLIYNPAETKFLYLAKKKGAKTLNGLTMLEQQAEKSWEIWNQ